MISSKSKVTEKVPRHKRSFLKERIISEMNTTMASQMSKMNKTKENEIKGWVDKDLARMGLKT